MREWRNNLVNKNPAKVKLPNMVSTGKELKTARGAPPPQKKKLGQMDH
jgi:hypothetical protein